MGAACIVYGENSSIRLISLKLRLRIATFAVGLLFSEFG